jgi:isoleucyl-tRNA synthetase
MMNDSTSDKAQVRDYRDTLFLPKTDFPMRAGLPQREPEILKRWQDMGLYRRTREAAGDGTRFILHDGPPYANGNIHLGTALNKILKDIVSRSQWMMGKDANYVPGWDCHGLPIEWKVEETYRAKGLDKDEVPINEFRRECREFAAKWIDVQREEFQRLGVLGDWKDPYTTMKFESEARIARELMKFAMSGQLYRGSKPVMWSVVEHTALAEAEVEYHDYTSDTVWVTFPVHLDGGTGELEGASVVIWTTTPWTIPGNRAISYSPRIGYGLYRVDEAAADNWAKPGGLYVIADALADEVMKAARVESHSRIGDVSPDVLSRTVCRHPLHGKGYDFAVPLLAGDHVTDEAGTGFVHTAPGHGREDFDVWTENAQALEAAGIDPAIPFTVDAAGAFTADAPGFEGIQVINDKGEKGDANDAVIKALVAAGNLIARGRLKHQYPHSWRSKKPVIFRNTPQWFITMGDGKPDGLRARALKAIDEVDWVPPAGRNRMRGMIETRPDWVISRQRAWGVPITVFRNQESGVTIPGAEFDRSEELIDRIAAAFAAEGADAWFRDGAKERFLDGLVDDPAVWEQVRDILDVWFESGSTHAFVLEVRDDLKVQRRHEGGSDRVMYLEGSDQHRGWFHSSLLESCGTRGRAPYDVVLTHGFVVDEDGRKMSKSLGNVVEPQDVIRQSGAEILRLWAASSDYAEDLRLGPEILKSNVDAYRKLRNTLRYLLGALAGYSKDEAIAAADMPELERYMLHRLHETGNAVRRGYESFDFKRAYWALLNFMTIDLSAFYFDIRKDALYCDPLSSTRRRACRTLMDKLFHCLTAWLAPVMCFTMEEAWQSRFGDGSVHLQRFPDVEPSWRDNALGAKWDKVREVRRVVTGALEIERQVKKTIGASLEAAPVVYVSDPDLLAALDGVDLAEISITSAARLVAGEGPTDAFRLEEVAGVAVVPEHARGRKCARSWKISEDVGADPEFPDITPRDAEAVREWQEVEGQV